MLNDELTLRTVFSLAPARHTVSNGTNPPQILRPFAAGRA